LKTKPLKLIALTAMLLAFLLLFTRPSDYRNLLRDISGTLEDQWCAWSQLFSYECDRWRHAHGIIDEARQFGEQLRARLPDAAPLGDAGKKD
jgi:hypothetical protein